MNIALTFENVTKTYPGVTPVHALREITTTLPEKAFAALIGPSGSGKTTFLNLAAGLDTPSQGKIYIGNQNLSELTKSELNHFRSFNVGFIFQSYNLLPNLTALENIELISIIRGDDPKAVRTLALHALEQVALGDKKDSYPSQLSGGQQQRVAIARALVTRPKIVFADEPTANLDSKTAFQLIELFEALNEKESMTFLFSTHDSRMISRVRQKITLSDGMLTDELTSHV